jgi:cytochrome c oxidase assembly factor CtaG
VALGVALLSPIDTFDGELFALHMAQHLLLLLVVPPLLWLGAPLLPILWALPATERRGAGRLLGPRGHLHRVFHVLTNPALAATLFVGGMLLWHVPRLYDAAQARTMAHDLEHLTFLGTGLLYWWPVIHPTGGVRRLQLAPGLLYFLAPMLSGNVLGALLTLANVPVYQTYQAMPRTWGISVLQDQQLGGLLMWIPGGMFWAIPLVVTLALLLRDDETQQPDEDQSRRGYAIDRTVP